MRKKKKTADDMFPVADRLYSSVTKGTYKTFSKKTQKYKELCMGFSLLNLGKDMLATITGGKGKTATAEYINKNLLGEKNYKPLRLDMTHLLTSWNSLRTPYNLPSYSTATMYDINQVYLNDISQYHGELPQSSYTGERYGISEKDPDTLNVHHECLPRICPTGYKLVPTAIFTILRDILNKLHWKHLQPWHLQAALWLTYKINSDHTNITLETCLDQVPGIRWLYNKEKKNKNESRFRKKLIAFCGEYLPIIKTYFEPSKKPLKIPVGTPLDPDLRRITADTRRITANTRRKENPQTRMNTTSENPLSFKLYFPPFISLQGKEKKEKDIKRIRKLKKKARKAHK